jgi:hypothetical protein
LPIPQKLTFKINIHFGAHPAFQAFELGGALSRQIAEAPSQPRVPNRARCPILPDSPIPGHRSCTNIPIAPAMKTTRRGRRSVPPSRMGAGCDCHRSTSREWKRPSCGQRVIWAMSRNCFGRSKSWRLRALVIAISCTPHASSAFLAGSHADGIARASISLPPGCGAMRWGVF